MAKKSDVVMIDVHGMFSRLVVYRELNEMGYWAIKMRWGGASEPVAVVDMAEAKKLAAAIMKLTEVA